MKVCLNHDAGQNSIAKHSDVAQFKEHSGIGWKFDRLLVATYNELSS